MRAVILAAGRGRRLGADRPKCLLELGGKTLIERRLDMLDMPARIVVGFQQEKIRARVGDRAEFVVNPRFTEGSVWSLEAGLAGLAEDVLVMDADVLCHPDIARGLLAGPALAFAADARSRPTGEEMMVTVRDGRVLEISRRPRLSCDWMGETVGFTRIPKAALPALRSHIREDGDYEAALDRLVKEFPAVALPVELPWTEIDFPEDVERARRLLAELP